MGGGSKLRPLGKPRPGMFLLLGGICKGQFRGFQTP